MPDADDMFRKIAAVATTSQVPGTSLTCRIISVVPYLQQVLGFDVLPARAMTNNNVITVYGHDYFDYSSIQVANNKSGGILGKVRA